MDINEKLRNLPNIDEVLKQPEVQELMLLTAREVVVSAIRDSIEEIRNSIKKGQEVKVDIGSVIFNVKKRLLETDKRSLRRVINGTGILLHTNLGRAKLADKAVDNIAEVSKGYSCLLYTSDAADE